MIPALEHLQGVEAVESGVVKPGDCCRLKLSDREQQGAADELQQSLGKQGG